MTWCVLRNESRALPVNVIELRFDADRPSACRSHGQLTVESGLAEIRLALDSFVEQREAVVLERGAGSAIEMRLSGGTPGQTTFGRGGTTYEWTTL